MSSQVDDLRPVPVFPRNSEETTDIMEHHLYKPTQYHLAIEKRLLTFNKEETTER